MKIILFPKTKSIISQPEPRIDIESKSLDMVDWHDEYQKKYIESITYKTHYGIRLLK